jgi:hypothetical protein
MKRALILLVAASALLASASAGADDTCEPGVQCLKMVTIYGRAPRPIVVVELRRIPAATAAGQAHEEMRQRWLERLVPATLKH